MEETMKLIGAGLPRTGTLSQKVALEMLGVGPCYHMVNVLADLDLVGQWSSALEGKAAWGEIFDGFQSTVDWPGSFFYADLVDVYPESKVLLSVREGDAWARSMRETIYDVLYGDSLIGHLSAARSAIDPKWCGYIDLMKQMWDRSGLLDPQDTSDAAMSRALQRYHEEVQQTVPSDRLLVWSVADGWEPLCEFLELPVPDMPFPHLNDSKEFTKRIVDGALLTLQAWKQAQEQPESVPSTS
jgi:hypothetical protein